jgi:hypothetical protein
VEESCTVTQEVRGWDDYEQNSSCSNSGISGLIMMPLEGLKQQALETDWRVGGARRHEWH